MCEVPSGYEEIIAATESEEFDVNLFLSAYQIGIKKDSWFLNCFSGLEHENNSSVEVSVE